VLAGTAVASEQLRPHLILSFLEDVGGEAEMAACAAGAAREAAAADATALIRWDRGGPQLLGIQGEITSVPVGDRPMGRARWPDSPSCTARLGGTP